jgi:hypothetical protein
VPDARPESLSRHRKKNPCGPSGGRGNFFD